MPSVADTSDLIQDKGMLNVSNPTRLHMNSDKTHVCVVRPKRENKPVGLQARNGSNEAL